jgi:hypothetical protein
MPIVLPACGTTNPNAVRVQPRLRLRLCQAHVQNEWELHARISRQPIHDGSRSAPLASRPNLLFGHYLPYYYS